jgi:shikimate 5-dehydrogenase
MLSLETQNLALPVHQDRYPAIDPRTTLKDTAAGKVVFIAGASRGIGQATAVAFAEAGARAIHLAARSRDALEETRAHVTQINPDTDRALFPTAAWHSAGQ